MKNNKVKEENEQLKLPLEINFIIGQLADSIEKCKILKETNFGLFYRDGKISFINLALVDPLLKEATKGKAEEEK